MTKDRTGEEKFYLLSGTTLNELLLQHKLLNGIILLTSHWPLAQVKPSHWPGMSEPPCSLYLPVQCTACIRCTGDGTEMCLQMQGTTPSQTKGEKLMMETRGSVIIQFVKVRKHYS